MGDKRRPLLGRRKRLPLGVLLLVMQILSFLPVALARPGVIEFSDGQSIAGDITLTPGKQLQVLGEGAQRMFGLEQVREIRFAPAEEQMERAWRFLEAGKPLRFTDEAIEAIIAAGYSQEYGVRQLRRAVQTLVEIPLSQLILSGNLATWRRVVVAVESGRAVLRADTGHQVQQ